MIVFASGTLFENQTHRGQALAVGCDNWTNQHYGNGTLLCNSLSCLKEDSGLIGLRSKQLELRLLDRRKTLCYRSQWQTLNLALPLLLVLLLSIGFKLYRYRKFG